MNELETIKANIQRIEKQIEEVLTLLKGNDFGFDGLAGIVRNSLERIDKLEIQVNSAIHERDVELLKIRAEVTSMMNSTSKTHDDKMQKLALKMSYIMGAFAALNILASVISKLLIK